MNVLQIIASPRIESLSAKAIQYIHSTILEQTLDKELPQYEEQVQSSIVDLRLTPLPIYTPDSFQTSENYEVIREQVIAADCYIVSTPDYHGSMSGMLKNFFDYFWKEFAGKTFASVCASHERGVTATEQIRTVVRQCYGWSLPYYICVDEESFDDNGEFHGTVKKRLSMMARDITVYGKMISSQRKADLQSTEQDTFMAHYRIG